MRVVVLCSRVRVEEKMLAEKFGDEWLSYKAGVRRWM